MLQLQGVPVYSIEETAVFTGQVRWSPEAAGGFFLGNTVYTAHISLHAVPRYTFNGVKADCFTVLVLNPAPTLQTQRSDSCISCYRIHFRPYSNHQPDQRDCPVPGAQPVKSLAGNGQYSGTISGQPDHPTFQLGVVYTATITLLRVSHI